MKQLIIDISETPSPNTQRNSTIIFYRKNYWKAAAKLERGSDDAELDFCCYLSTLGHPNNPVLSIESVEHAKQLIAALELAIKEKWLFTEHEISRYNTSATDTRADIVEKIEGVYNHG